MLIMPDDTKVLSGKMVIVPKEGWFLNINITLPAATAIKIWKIERAGYQSPVVALTLGNHSYIMIILNIIDDLWLQKE